MNFDRAHVTFLTMVFISISCVNAKMLVSIQKAFKLYKFTSKSAQRSKNI